MTTAAEQYRALVAKLEEINDPRSQEERDAQMSNFKGAYQDYQDAEADAAKKAAAPAKQPATSAPAAQPSPVSGDVKKIQTLLNQKGAQLAVDGKLGAQTLAAILKNLEAAPAAQPQAAQPAQEPQAGAGQYKPFTVGQQSAAPADPFAKGGLFNR